MNFDEAFFHSRFRTRKKSSSHTMADKFFANDDGVMATYEFDYGEGGDCTVGQVVCHR